LTDTSLPFPPTAVRAYYADHSSPSLPCLAVAAGTTVYIYKNRSPLTKFDLPKVEADARESEIWNKMWVAVKDYMGMKRESGIFRPPSTVGASSSNPTPTSVITSSTTTTPTTTTTTTTVTTTSSTPSSPILVDKDNKTNEKTSVTDTMVKELQGKEIVAKTAVIDGCKALSDLRDSGEVGLTNKSLELMGAEVDIDKVELVWLNGSPSISIKVI